MGTTLEEKQTDQPQQKQSKEGTISQGINTINDLARARRGFTNPLGKVGSGIIAQTALRGFAAFLAGPGLPIAIAIISVFIFTFIIVAFGGAPLSETNNQSAKPTITPTPAAP